MSEKQAAVEAKQEGEFTLKGKAKPKKPKQLNKKEEITKVNLKEPLINTEPEVKKVVIKNEDLKPDENAIQIGESKEIPVGEPSGDSA